MDAPWTTIVPCQDGPRVEFADDPANLTPRCHRCAERLDLCQPSVDEPDELLGTCRCGAWHHVAYWPDRSAVLVTYLPLKTLISEAAATVGQDIHGVAREVHPRLRPHWA